MFESTAPSPIAGLLRWFSACLLLTSACAVAPHDEESPDQTHSGRPAPVESVTEALTAGSCQDACGTSAPNNSCWCDAACSKYGDCCSDYVAQCQSKPSASSCASHCDGFNSQGKCHCDSACVTYGDCCGDYGAQCTPVLEHNVETFLNEHPWLRTHLRFEVEGDIAELSSTERTRRDSNNRTLPYLHQGTKVGILKSYDSWPGHLKYMLAAAFDHVTRGLLQAKATGSYEQLSDYFPVDAHPENLVPRTFLAEGGTSTLTVLSRSNAEKLYINQVAMQMALFHTGQLPWEPLLDSAGYDAQELLYSSAYTFLYFRHPREEIAFYIRDPLPTDAKTDVGLPGYVVLNQVLHPWEGVIPSGPSQVIKQMMAYGLDFRPRRRMIDFVGEVLKWSRNFRHAIGRPNNYDMERRSGFWGGQAFSDMFSKPLADSLSSDTEKYLLTNGCGSTLHFMYQLLKLVSIPLQIGKYTLQGNHRYGEFHFVDYRTDGSIYQPRFVLSHGDVPYEKRMYAHNGEAIDYTSWLVFINWFNSIKEAAEKRYGPADNWQDLVPVDALSHLNMMFQERTKLLSTPVAAYCTSTDAASFRTKLQEYSWLTPYVLKLFTVDQYPIRYSDPRFPSYDNTLTYDAMRDLASKASLDCAAAERKLSELQRTCYLAHRDSGTLHLAGECPNRW